MGLLSYDGVAPTLGRDVFLAPGAYVIGRVTLGEDSVVAAGSLIAPRTVIAPGSLVLGRPAKVLRPATAKEKRLGLDGAQHYVDNARTYRALLASAEPATRLRRSGQSRRRPPR